MSTAIDTNVLVDLLAGQEGSSRLARQALATAQNRGGLVVSPAVFAELLAFPGPGVEDVHALLSFSRIVVAWDVTQVTWRRAGLAYSEYAERRRRSGAGQPRRILADFLVGAQALEAVTLLTRDVDFCRINFPELRIETIE